jgi:hypothetical protein
MRATQATPEDDAIAIQRFDRVACSVRELVVGRQARAAASGAATQPWVAAMLRRSNPDDASGRRAWIESGGFQVVRGPRILPIADHRGRRPELEITRALQVTDRYLQARGPSVSAKARHHCLAGVLLAMEGRTVPEMDALEPQRGTIPREDMAHVVRMRLQRAPHPLDEAGYQLLLWEVVRAQDPAAPFPFARRVPVWLHPTADGQTDVEVIVEPPGGLGAAERLVLDRAIQGRLSAGPIREPGEGLVVEIPAFTGRDTSDHGEGTGLRAVDSPR